MTTIIGTGVEVTLDESAGLQNFTATPTPAGDADDNDTPLPLPSAFSARLTTLQAGTAMEAALSGYTGAEGNTGSNAFTITPAPGGSITDISFVGSDGLALNGTESGLFTLDGSEILLYTDTNNNILLGKVGDTIVFAAYIEETGTPVSGGKIWTVLYQPLMHPDTNSPNDHDYAVDLTGKVFIGTSQDLEFSLANAPSGQNLFLMFTTANPTVVDGRISDPTIIATGKDPANQSDGFNINTGDTINTSQAGGPTTFGTNNQMITEQEGIRFTFVTGALQDMTIPNLSQTEAKVEANIDFTAMFNAWAADFDVVQLQSGKTAQVRISAFTTDVESGVEFIDGYADDTVVAISSIKVFNISTGLEVTTGINISIKDGVAFITGVKAGYRIEYTTAAEHNRVLIENGAALDAKGNDHADFDIGGFTLRQVSTAKAEIGSKMVFEDDGPTASAALGDGSVTHDETAGLDDDADDTNDAAVIALFAGVANVSNDMTAGYAQGDDPVVDTSGSDYGQDEEGGTTTFSLDIADEDGTDSGLQTTDGTAIFLFKEGDLVVGRIGSDALTAAVGAAAFAVAIDADSGVLSLAQYASLWHEDDSDHDDVMSIAAGALYATVTVTDGDDDVDTDSVDIGARVAFQDDGPTLAFGNLIGTGTTLAQYGYWNMAAGADGLGTTGLDITLESVTLVRPDGTLVAGSGTLVEQSPSPNGTGAYQFAGTLSGDFNNNGLADDPLIDFMLTAFADGTYALDLAQGFGSTVVLSSADGKLDAGGPDPVRTLTIGSENIVFFAADPLASEDGILTGIGLGEPDPTEAELQTTPLPPYIGSGKMNVSTSGIGIDNNNFDGNNISGIDAGDESFVINPETLLTGMRVFIDNSVGGYNTATEELYYRVFYADGTSSLQTLVGDGDLRDEAGGQKSFLISADGSNLIDAVQLTMAKGTVKIPVIQFIQESEDLASDIQLTFSATLTDGDGDTATSSFAANLFANELGNPDFHFLLEGTDGWDAFNIDLSGSKNLYRVEGFDTSPDLRDTLVLIGDQSAVVSSIDNSGADSIVTVTESGGQATTITVVGVNLLADDIVIF